jgi:quinol monooxygenase YgiN
MPDPVVAIACAEVFPGKEAEFEALAKELFALVRRKKYGADRMVRSLRQPTLYYDIRDWSSQEAAVRAHQDPEIRALWARMAKICKLTELVSVAREVRL